MPLSEREQRLLSQMEEQLLSDDPRFASTMRGTAARQGMGKRLVIGIGGVVLGLVILLAAVTITQPILGVVAFVMMVASAVYAMRGTRSRPGLKVVDGNGTAKPAKRRAARQSNSFVQRMELRWQERRNRGDI